VAFSLLWTADRLGSGIPFDTPIPGYRNDSWGGKLEIKSFRTVIGEKMKVNFFAGLRRIVGQKTVEIPISEGATADQLVEDEIVR
jgi:hypothetical protein